MQFNPGDNTGIVDEINDIAHSDNNNYPLESKARRCNYALDRFCTLAFRAAHQDDGRTFDDGNQGTDPIETQDFVLDQQAYDILDFTSEVLRILRVEALNSAGKAITLTGLDKSEIQGALTEYKNTPGEPEEYDIVGNTIFLYPAPHYNKVDGLKFYFNRNKVSFTAADTSTSPGIPSIFHMYIARLAGYLELEDKGEIPRGAALEAVKKDESDIIDYYSHLEKPKKALPILHR